MAEKKTLSAKEVIADIRAGATDEFLMKRYSVSEKGLRRLFQKLIAAKALTQADLDRRCVEEVEAVIIEEEEAEQARSTPAPTEVYRCPSCGMPQNYEFKVCPQCGVIIEKFLKKIQDQKARQDQMSREQVEGKGRNTTTDEEALSQSVGNAQDGHDPAMAQKMEKLEEALKAGVLSQSEYEAKRAEFVGGSEKLGKLKEAFDAGILSKAEFESKRADLLVDGQSAGVISRKEPVHKVEASERQLNPTAGKGLRIAGGILGIISGVFGTGAALFTLVFGGLGAAFEATGAETVIGLGWGGLFFSFLVIIFGSVTLGVKNKTLPILLIISAILGAILGGVAVAVCLILALVGGILALCGAIRYGRSGGTADPPPANFIREDYKKPFSIAASNRTSLNLRELINLQELHQTDLPVWDRFALFIISGTALMVTWFLFRWLTTSWGWFAFWLVLMGAATALGGLILKDRLNIPAKYLAIAGIALLILNILLALVPERRGVGSIARQSSGIERQTSAAARAEPKRISDISHYDVQSKFVDPKGLTDAQRPREWPKYKGQWVSWSGTVAQVRERSGGRVSLVVDMGTSLTGHDVTVELGGMSREKAIRLSKGEYVQFIGKLESQPGYIMGITLTDGVLKEDAQPRSSPSEVRPIATSGHTRERSPEPQRKSFDPSLSSKLIAASYNGQTQTVRLLLSQGADPNAKGNEEATALMAACLKGHLDVVRLLIESGANINARDVKGWTALRYASNYGHTGLINLLESRGASE